MYPSTTMLRSRVLLRLILSFAPLAAWACGGGDLSLPSGPEPQVEIVQGDEQVGRPGLRLAEPLIVRLVDAAGNGIPDRGVVWVVSAGGGDISPATGTTDAEGFASAEWTLGPVEGPNRVDAQVPGIGSVLFTAVASSSEELPRPSAGQSSVTADPATIDAGTGAATITVTVRDERGDPLPGATVRVQATGEGNTLTQPSSPTDAEGRATATLGSTVAGEKVVSAVVNESVELTETAVVTVIAADGVDRLVFLVPPRDVDEGETFTVEVALVDRDGDVVPLTGVFVYVDLFREGRDTPTNTDAVGERFENTVDGVAAFDLRINREGRYRLRALTDDLPELGPHGPEPYLFSDVFEVD